MRLWAAGPAEMQRKAFLSAATLLIVPATLVQHWVFQVQQHTRFGELRLLVAPGGKIPAAHSLAWDYDLVCVMPISIET